MEYYRFVVNGEGIYQVISKESDLNDPRRANKPDGSWLPKIGEKYPGAISFWTPHGLKTYQESGLMDWHSSIVKNNVEVQIIDRPEQVLYEDEYQIILMLKYLKIKEQLPVDKFLKKINLD